MLYQDGLIVELPVAVKAPGLLLLLSCCLLFLPDHGVAKPGLLRVSASQLDESQALAETYA